MSVSFGFSRGRLIVVPVVMRHAYVCEPVMALDTGARLTVVTPKVARELGFEPDEMEREISVVGATGAEPAALLRVKSVSVLGEKVTNMRVLCHQLPPTLGLDGILGLNFLKEFRIVIDNETETLTLTRWRE